MYLYYSHKLFVWIIIINVFTEEEVKNADNLDFKWLDLEEKDERTIAEILDDMQTESDGIAEAVTMLKNLLGGIEI